ncbi:hypothetical protein SDC9_101505 [bioreactor metagenome]|uniref:Uncharacterized protein n=1 Tax=bioreactor metagenome TaxID=1076179 RepID=A0A645ANC1_9ZZZZ
MFFIGIILFIILYIFAFDKFLELNVKNLFFGFVAFGVVIPQTMYERRKQSVLNKRLSIEEELESKENELKSYFDSYKKSVVSFEYSNPKTINLLKHSISSGRADNIKEAINCMLDDYHKQQLLIKQDEIVENSKVAANAAKRTAVYSLGTFINTRKQ